MLYLAVEAWVFSCRLRCEAFNQPMANRFARGVGAVIVLGVNGSGLARLGSVLRSFESCLVAYSGGVDSVLLAHVAHRELGDRALAVIADSPSLPRRELEEALAIGERFGFPVRVIRTAEFENSDYVNNPPNRCYFCKHALFTDLARIAGEEGFQVIAYGENVSDLGDFRPGAQAAAEFSVRAPLKEAGLTKEDIRALSRELGLPTAEKPQAPCLSSRIPHGQAVTRDKLGMIEAAEACLHDLGLREVRVRHHETEVAGGLARVELGEEETEAVADRSLWPVIDARLREIGYGDVVLDERGYRRGSLNVAG